MTHRKVCLGDDDGTSHDELIASQYADLRTWGGILAESIRLALAFASGLDPTLRGRGCLLLSSFVAPAPFQRYPMI